MNQKPLILKFGGTSLGNAQNLLQIVRIVRELSSTQPLVVVLSAVSTHTKSQGVTTRLLKAANDALKPGSSEYISGVSSILNTHLDLIKKTMFKSTNTEAQQSIYKALVDQIQRECDKLKGFLEAIEVIEEVSPRSLDMIVSYGEKLSCQLFAALLEYSGIQASFVSLEKLIAKSFDSRNFTQEFYDYLSDRLREILDPKLKEGYVSVVTGYFGPVPGSLLSTIGRGYTDLTAALAAVGLEAQELQIWKEVDGIYTADPRKVQNAQLISEILPEEAAELTYYGSEVIHPFTMEQVIRKKIPIRVRNTFYPERLGTVIRASGNTFSGNRAGVFPAHKRSTSETGTAKHAVAVTVKDHIHVLNIQSNRKSVSHGFLKLIFETLDRYGIIVDLISTSQAHVSLALSLEESDGFNAKSPLKLCIQELKQFGNVTVRQSMAILSLVGREMKSMVGMAAKMFNCLSDNHINLEMISQGASEINISCVIESKDSIVALNAVHDSCVHRGLTSTV